MDVTCPACGWSGDAMLARWGGNIHDGTDYYCCPNCAAFWAGETYWTHVCRRRRSRLRRFRHWFERMKARGA